MFILMNKQPIKQPKKQQIKKQIKQQIKQQITKLCIKNHLLIHNINVRKENI